LVKIDKKQWTASFKSWYLKHIIEKHLEPNSPSGNVPFDQHFEHIENFKDSIEKQFQNVWLGRRKKVYQNFKKSETTLFNAIFKKNVPIEMTWEDMLAKHPDLLINTFPIIIIKKANILKQSESLKNMWDLAISYQVPLTEKTEVKCISQLSLNYALFNNVNLTNDFKQKLSVSNKNLKDITEFELPIIHSNTVKRLALLSLRQRLIMAKKLASTLSHANNNIRIFHLKNAYFISTLSKEANEQLIFNFAEYGIRESKMKGEKEAGIVEVLLDTDKETFVFIQNGLIDPNNSKTFLWQKSILLNLKIAGIKEVNIWSVETLNRPHLLFGQMKKIINTYLRKEDNQVAV